MGSVMSLEDVRRIVEATARDNAIAFADVDVSPTSDSWGDDALRVVLTVEPETIIDGTQAFNMIGGLSRELLRHGEERFPIVEIAVLGEECGDGAEDVDAR